MKDNKKTNKTRRQRGYAFESSIVKKLNQSSYWIAKRLGSPSTNLPDVMGIDNFHKTVIALEAKSTVGNIVYVPQDQIERCEQWIKHFQLYEIKQVVLGFKFGQIKGKRKLKTFYKIFPHTSISPCEVKGDSNGNTWKRINDVWVPLQLENFKI